MRDEYDFSHAKRRGPVVKPKGKTRITIMLDNDVIEHFRGLAGDGPPGYQTLINDALRESMQGVSLKKELRQIVRDELKRAGG